MCVCVYVRLYIACMSKCRVHPLGYIYKLYKVQSAVSERVSVRSCCFMFAVRAAVFSRVHLFAQVWEMDARQVMCRDCASNKHVWSDRRTLTRSRLHNSRRAQIMSVHSFGTFVRPCGLGSNEHVCAFLRSCVLFSV